MDTPNTQIHGPLIFLAGLDTGTSIKNGRLKLVLSAQTYPLSEVKNSYNSGKWHSVR